MNLQLSKTEFIPTVVQSTELRLSVLDELREYLSDPSLLIRFQLSESDIIQKIINEVMKEFNIIIEELYLNKYIKDYKLKNLLINNNKLKEIISKSIYEIEKYLNNMKIQHCIEVKLWEDIEVEWSEIVIDVKVKYKSHEEKMKIWEDLCKILDEIDKEKLLLIDVKEL